MKIISKTILLSSAFSLVLPQASLAFLSSAYASLVDTSPNQAVESRPAHSFQLAAVHFITGNSQAKYDGNDAGSQEFLPGDLCKQSGYTHRSCPAGYVKGEACSYDSSYVKECIASDVWCRNKGYKVTSCTAPQYLAEKCPNSDSLYKSCQTDNAKACKEGGYEADCGVGKVGEQACPYDSNFKACVCNPCTGFAYTSAQATAEGYIPGEVCNSCGTMKYKRTENACNGFKTCDCGGSANAKVCWSGSVKKFDNCKECCDSKFKYDSSNCTGNNQLAGNSCGGKYELCKAPAKVGDILYGDGTIASEILEGKTPVGIVFDTEKHLAVALTHINKDGKPGNEDSFVFWSTTYCGTTICPTSDPLYAPACDLSLENCSEGTENNCGTDGRYNTNIMLAECCDTEGNRGTEITPLGTCSKTYRADAAHAVNNYEPSGCEQKFCKKTHWFLPSMQELITIYTNKTPITQTLNNLQNVETTPLIQGKWGANMYLSSTEAEYNEYYIGRGKYLGSWGINMMDGYRGIYFKQGGSGHRLRPVVKYE